MSGGRSNRRRLVATALAGVTAVVVIWALAGSAPAAPPCDRTWDGGGATLAWSTAANWSGDVLPQPGENVCISTAGPIVHSSGTDSIGSLQGTGGVSLTGGEIDLTYTGNDASIARFDISGGTLGGVGVLQVSSTMAWSGGSMAQAGTTRVLPSATLTHGSSSTFLATGRTLDVEGTLELVSTAGIVQSTAPAALIQVAASGTLVKSTNAGNATINVVVDNDGSVSSSAGTLFLTGGSGAGQSTGDYSGAAGTVSFDGGTHTLGDGVTLSGTAIAAGTVTVPNAATVTAAGTNSFSGGTLGGTGTFNVTGTLTWSGGSMAEAGQTTIAAAGKITHGSSSTFLATGRTLEVQGTLELVSTAGIVQSTAPAALIQVASSGTLVKSTNAGNATINVPLRNDGTVTATAGRLNLSAATSSPHTGTFSGVNTAAHVALTGGTHTLGPGAQLTGFTEVGGSATVEIPDATTIAVPGTLLQSGGTLGGAGTLNVTGVLQWSGGDEAGPGATTIAAAGEVQVSGCGATLVDGRQVTNEGAIRLSAGATVNSFGPPVSAVENSGLLEIDDTIAGGCSNGWFGDALIHNTGTVTKIGGATSAALGTLDNDGAVTVSAGDLRITGATGTAQSGTFTANGAGTTITFGDGTTALAQGASITGSVSVVCCARLAIAPAMTITVAAPDTLTLDGGTIAGGGTIAIAGTLIWPDGEQVDGGTTLVKPGGNATVGSATGNASLSDDRSFVNEGDTVVSGGTFSVGPGASIQNVGTLDVEGSSLIEGSYIFGYGLSSLLHNAGLLRKADAGDAQTTVPIDNDGTIEVSAGSLALRSLLNYSTLSKTLTGGTYAAHSAKLALPAELDTNAARLILDGPSAQVVAQVFEGEPETDALATLRRNAGAGVIEVAGARSQPLPGPFHNAGALRIGAGSALTIAGDFIAEPDSNLRPRIAGTSPGTTGTLTASGAATLNGTLALDNDPGFHPADGTEIQLMTFASRTGGFAQLTGTDLGGGLSYSALYAAGNLKVHVGPTGAALSPSTLASAELLTTSSSDPAQVARPTGAAQPAAHRSVVDDKSFRIAKGRWTRRPFERDHGGSFTVSHTRGATLVTPRVRGSRLELIAHTCPTCGAVEVIWGGRRVVVSLRSRRSRRAVLPVFARAKPRAGTVRLRATSARRVAIDALVVS